MIERALPKNGLSSEINVTPMADIMLVLLIIFMITTPLLQDDVSLNLPKARNPLDVKAEGLIIISLTRDGRIYWGKAQVTEQEMIQALSQRLTAEIDKSVFLKADQALAYGSVVHVVSECRKLGVERMGLMAEKEAQPMPR